MKRQEKYQFIYKNAKGEEKVCYPKSKDQVDENRRKAKELGLTVVSVKKLYPFSMEKNQHNFELIANRCFNIMCDMESGDIPMDEAEYDRLYDLREKAEKYFCYYDGPVTWVTWDDLKEMKEISEMAVNIRIDTCIRTGRLQDIKYC